MGFTRRRGAPKQKFNVHKKKIDCYCAKFKKFEDAPEWMREDYKATSTYDPKTGAKIKVYYKKCPRCRGKKWLWQVNKELMYQCFGGPLNAQFKTWKEAGDDYTQFNRGTRGGEKVAKAILVWDGGHIAVSE